MSQRKKYLLEYIQRNAPHLTSSSAQKLAASLDHDRYVRQKKNKTFYFTSDGTDMIKKTLESVPSTAMKFSQVVEHVPLLKKTPQESILGSHLFDSQLGALHRTSTMLKNETKNELDNKKKEKVHDLIQKINDKHYGSIPVLMKFDFFDVYAFHTQFKSKSILNLVAESNVTRSRYSLDQLVDFLCITNVQDFGQIAYKDWLHHKNTSKSIRLLQRLKRRGDESFSIRNFLVKIIEKHPNIDFLEIKPFLNVYNLGTKQQIVQVLLQYLKRYTTKPQKHRFIDSRIEDPKIRQYLHMYIESDNIYQVDQSMLR